MGDEIGQTTRWFYSLKEHTVVPEGHGKAKDLLGPYATPEEAAQALESFRSREEQIEAEDHAWRDPHGGEGTD